MNDQPQTALLCLAQIARQVRFLERPEERLKLFAQRFLQTLSLLLQFLRLHLNRIQLALELFSLGDNLFFLNSYPASGDI